MIFDSSSDWLMVEGKECKNCEENKYDPFRSSFFNERSSLESNRRFGTIMHFKGRQVSDEVCMERGNLCIKPFSWFYITDQYGLPSKLVDGVVGLTQNDSLLGGYEPVNNHNPELSILQYLYLNGHITEVGFSTHFTQSLYDSYIDLGAPRPDGISSYRDTVTLKIPQGYFYSV